MTPLSQKLMEAKSEGERLLDIAEDAHMRGDSKASEWYLRSIAHLLIAIVRALESSRPRGG